MAMTLITTNTITSSAASTSFTSSIDSTYKLYIFKFIDVHCSNDGEVLRFQASIDGGTNFTNMTTTNFYDYTPADGNPTLGYHLAGDVHDGTPTHLGYILGSDNDQTMAGELFLFNPSNTTYVKHWYSRIVAHGDGGESADSFAAGYLNTTSAINAVKFDMSVGTIDAAVIKMYGVG
jgi:hypothetical protein